MKRVFVTGANGTVGSRLTKFILNKNLFVTALVTNKDKSILSPHKNLEIIEGSINNKNLLTKVIKGSDFVIHLAALKNDEKDSYKVNVLGTRNVVIASEINKIKKIVYISTASVLIKNKGIYAETKLAGEDLVKKTKTSWIILRPSVIYGKNMGGVFGTIVDNIQKLSVIPVFGTGHNPFYPILINDFNTAVTNVLTDLSLKNKTYDIGSLSPIKFNDMIKSIAKQMGKKIKIIHIPPVFGVMLARTVSLFSKRPIFTESNVLGSTQTILLNTLKASKDLKFTPLNLKQGMKHVFGQDGLIDREAIIILKNILGSSTGIEKIDDELIVRYKHGLLVNGLTPYKSDSWIFRKPYLLGGLSFLTPFYSSSLLARKLYLATIIIETSPISAKWLLPKKHGVIALIKFATAIGIRLVIKLFVAGLVVLTPDFYRKYLD